jgi:hypothetical protein
VIRVDERPALQRKTCSRRREMRRRRSRLWPFQTLLHFDERAYTERVIKSASWYGLRMGFGARQRSTALELAT